MLIDFLISVMLFLTPAYFANSSPVLFGGGTPIDLNKNFIDKKRLFGDGKTIRGFFSGLFIGFILGVFFNFLLFTYSPFKNIFLASFVISFSTLLGDLFGSFLKRRFGIKRGKIFFFDQISFILIVFIIVYLFQTYFQIIKLDHFEKIFDPFFVFFLILFSASIHRIANIFANKIGIKKVPW